MKVFLSYHFDDKRPQQEQFVHRVFYHLSRQADIEPYCYAPEAPKPDEAPNAPPMSEADIQEARKRYWQDEVGPALGAAGGFVLFVGPEFGSSQQDEALAFRVQAAKKVRQRAMVVEFPGACQIPEDLLEYRAIAPVVVENLLDSRSPAAAGQERFSETEAERCAQKITEWYCGEESWIRADGLPTGYPFMYEKVIISEFADGGGQLVAAERLQKGCPQSWPRVSKTGTARHDNPVPEKKIGKWRDEAKAVIVDTRNEYHQGEDPAGKCLSRLGLMFPEAGPRGRLCYPVSSPGNQLRAAVLVSGGIAPGINAVIDGIVSRHELYASRYAEVQRRRGYELEVRGYRDGFDGLLGNSYTLLTHDETRKEASRGGSMIGTSRCFDLMEDGDADSQGDPSEESGVEAGDAEDCRRRRRIRRSTTLNKVVNALDLNQIDILYVIGGDGSMKAAHAIWTRAQRLGKRVSVVAVPKTMDNDILWVWQAFGFLSAVEKAREFVMQLHTEVKSNPRLCIMQLFGSDSGFVVSHTALASGVCNLALIPESDFYLSEVIEYITGLLGDFRPGAGNEGPYGMILMAETAIPKDVDDYYKQKEIGLDEGEIIAIERFLKNDRHVQGQTPDELRTAGLKILKQALKIAIRKMKTNNEYWKHYRVFTNEPRHLLRAIDPSVQDVIFGQRLGSLAVDNAMAGYTDFMISQWLTEFVLVPLELVVLGRKRVPQTGIFWKAVLASTGQWKVSPEQEDS